MYWLNNISWEAAGLILAAAVIHASYQTGVSVLTLLSSHTLGFGHPNRRMLGLGASYILGVALATLALLLSFIYIFSEFNGQHEVLWTVGIACLAVVTSLAAFVLYFQRGSGTVLRWMPRSVATYLQKRSKKTQSVSEAAALGITTVIAELPFVLAPLFVMATLFRDLANSESNLLVGLYVLAVISPLLVTLGMISSGVKISALQRWREENKAFMQLATGIGLLALGLLLLLHAVTMEPIQ